MLSFNWTFLAWASNFKLGIGLGQILKLVVFELHLGKGLPVLRLNGIGLR